MATKANSKPCQTSDGAFFASHYWLERQTQNLPKHRRWSFLQRWSKTKSRSQFLQKPQSWMFDKILNFPLNLLQSEGCYIFKSI